MRSPEPSGEEELNRRARLVRLAFILALAGITARLFYLQIIQYRFLSGMALRQQERTLEIQPERGRIYDRHGRPLAINRPAASFFAVPSEIRDPHRAARLLARLFGFSENALVQKLRRPKAFVWIVRKVADEQAKQVRALGIPGIHELSEPVRVYPEGDLAAHVLGFVGVDNQGLDGVELQFDRRIRGNGGWVRVTRDAKGQDVPSASRVYKQAVPGEDLTLTLDSVIQHLAERELAKGIEQTRARAGSVLVMDPANGEILALANWPTFNPNQYARFSRADRRNRAVCDLYEPGSTFKIVTAASALESGAFQENDRINCENGQWKFNGLTIRDHEPQGIRTFADTIAFSSNIGAVKIALRVGEEKLLQTVRAFGFGRLTGIELPGEAAGFIEPRRLWKQWALASLPFGQGIGVTALQMTLAFAAVANEGRRPRPVLVLETAKAPALAPESEPPVVTRQTAARLGKVLQLVVQEGTGTEAAIPNYTVAGKTGTAQKSRPQGGYDPYRHVASFMGFLPADKPRVVIAVVLDEPKGTQWGGMVAAPVFRDLGREVAGYLGVAPDAPAAKAESPETKPVLIPNLVGMTLPEAKECLKTSGVACLPSGVGSRVIGQQPPAGAVTGKKPKVNVYLGETEMKPEGAVAIPNLQGQSLRNALKILNAYGLKATVEGSGLVNRQVPPPNTRVKLGAGCLLQCRDPEVLP